MFCPHCGQHHPAGASFCPVTGQPDGRSPVSTLEEVDRALLGDDALVLALDQVTDPHNVGAVLRSAAVFGAAAHVPLACTVMAGELFGVHAMVPAQRLDLELSGVDDGLNSFGQGVFLHEILEVLGATNVFADQTGWLSVTAEAAVGEGRSLTCGSSPTQSNDEQSSTRFSKKEKKVSIKISFYRRDAENAEEKRRD